MGNEAADLIDWFTAETVLTDRLYARTGSFCSGTSDHYDDWDQGISFFLPNMTWLQPPGHVHAMITETWADQTIQMDIDGAPGDKSLHVAAQRSASELVLRVVNAGGEDLQTTFQVSGAHVTGPASLRTLQDDDLKAVNTPSAPSAVAPKTSSASWKSATELTVTLPKYSFTIISTRLAGDVVI